MSSDPIVCLRGVKVRRNKTFTLQIDSLYAFNGLLLVQGRNGSGKSTLLECLIGMHRSGVAEVRVGGYSPNVRGERDEAFRRLGYVPQSLLLPLRWRVREYLEYAAWMKGLTGDATRPAITQVARDLEISARIDDRISSLSGGMRRRLLIGQALVSSPQVLLLDEPFSGLDAESQEILVGVLTNPAADRAVIATDHSGVLSPHSDQIARLASGSLVQT